MTEVLLVGGSVAGLMTALALDRRGVGVTLVDADPDAVAGDTELRRATPQAGHSHTFLARSRLLLAAEAPDALDDLRGAGCHEIVLADQRPSTVPAHAPHPDDSDLVALAARRPTFESALAQAARRRPGIRRLGPRRATGLLIDDGRVRGAAFDDGGVVEARLVVDATGRQTRMPGWLAEAGVPAAESSEECGIAYLTRFYRRPPGAPELPLDRGFAAGGSFDRYSCVVFPGDGTTFSVTFGVLPEDRVLRAGLRDGDAFDAAVRSIPSLAPWLDLAEPISEVRFMGGLLNRLRNPVVPGWTAVGDAAATTNPAHSRGCTLAAVHAVAVADAVVEHRDPVDLAEACAAVVEREQAPWVADSIEQDRDRLSRWRPEAPGASRPERPGLSNGEVFAAARHDAYVWRRFTQLQQLLDTPDALADPRLVARVRAVQSSGAVSPGPDGPSHPELVDLLSAVEVA